MTLSGFSSVVSRRIFVAVALGASLFVGSHAWAQAAAGPAPAAQTDNFKFSTDTAVMIYALAPDKAAAFETLWKSILTKLAASEKPELKELGANLKIYKVEAAAQPGQPQMYFMTADPASKTQTYNITTLLYDTNLGLFTRAEADTLFTPLKEGAFQTINAIPTVRLQP
jgi:hypothetical protein